ncbi:hypothetical protein V6N11_077473 [Hibiscus sabdariffa]|uniref:Hexosyltransferase n=1 Tax=Hibiscus sabdariffa TaxID=183260 RepID=A0ABR2TDB5_9ROSI
MEVTLGKAIHVYPDCSEMTTKLRAIAYNTEEQVQVLKNQESYLVQLAERTTPKVFSDNVLACSVVVNSTISYAKILSPSQKFRGGFLLNPPGKATIRVQSIENFAWSHTKYNSTLKEQKSDLTEIESADMKGTVNAAVEICLESEASFRAMHMFMNFSDPFLARQFDANVCTWAFGMNLLDLHEWRRKRLTMLYRDYMQLV